MRKSNVEKQREARRGRKTGTTQVDLEGLFALMLGKPLLPTQRRFIYDPDPVKAFMGPEGSGKSSTLCAAALARALLQPGSRGAVGRADYNDLMLTTKLTMERMLRNLPGNLLLDRDKTPPEHWWIRSVVNEGEPGELFFMGLKEDPGSQEFNHVWIDEMNEVDEALVKRMASGRLRAAGGDYCLGGAFNPTDMHHWLYTACTGKDYQEKEIAEPWMKLYQPLPRENAGNLPPDYYEKNLRIYDAQTATRLVHGKWGSTFDGKPVYGEFRRSFHTRAKLQYLAGLPLLRFWDFGYNHPVCLFAQLDNAGRLRILSEFIRERIYIQAFASLVKQQTALLYPGAHHVIDFGDPAARQEKDTGSTLTELNKEGITLRFRILKIDPGLNMVRKKLETAIKGEAALVLDSGACPITISALEGGYRMDDRGIKPVKDGFYDHPMDALRYGVTNLGGVSLAVPEAPPDYTLPSHMGDAPPDEVAQDPYA